MIRSEKGIVEIKLSEENPEQEMTADLMAIIHVVATEGGMSVGQLIELIADIAEEYEVEISQEPEDLLNGKNGNIPKERKDEEIYDISETARARKCYRR